MKWMKTWVNTGATTKKPCRDWDSTYTNLRMERKSTRTTACAVCCSSTWSIGTSKWRNRTMRLRDCRYWWMWARISSSIHLYWICGFWYRRRSLRRIVWGTSSRRQLRVTWRRVVAISMCLLIAAATLSPKPLKQSNPIAKTTKRQSS